MKNEKTPPGKKQRQKPADAESTSGRHPEAARENAGGNKEDNGGKPSEEELISHWRNPVTNQDEQEKITNAEGDDIPLANE